LAGVCRGIRHGLLGPGNSGVGKGGPARSLKGPKNRGNEGARGRICKLATEKQGQMGRLEFF